MPELAKLIRLSQCANDWSMTVDGEEFPWYVAPGVSINPLGISTDASTTDCPAVVLTLLAERVEVVHDLDSEETRA